MSKANKSKSAGRSVSGAPTVHLVCQAHIDPVWMWTWQEGAREAVSTFHTAANLLDEFPEFIFNHNESLLYEWIEDNDPALFIRIAKLVKQGRWNISGGWYLQPDCNMPAGETLVRQILEGRRYFAEPVRRASHRGLQLRLLRPPGQLPPDSGPGRLRAVHPLPADRARARPPIATLPVARPRRHPCPGVAPRHRLVLHRPGRRARRGRRPGNRPSAASSAPARPGATCWCCGAWATMAAGRPAPICWRSAS